MSIKKEMTKALFHEETLNTVQKMLTGIIDREIFPLENYDMMMRLFYSSGETINLEVITSSSSGYRYCKPIGYYTRENDLFQLHILKEFEKEAEVLEISKLLPEAFTLRKLSLKENAIIAAFSMETVVTALQAIKEKQNGNDQSGFNSELGIMIPEGAQNMQYDKSLMANGLKLELLMSMENYPQSYLDDEYNFEGPIGAYRPNSGGLNIDPIVGLENTFDRLKNMSLLSAFKRI